MGGDAFMLHGDTAATNADGLNNCTTAGAYRNESTCVVMEHTNENTKRLYTY
jgi:hypothetical protein